ncbi:hypothetical protein CEXT_1071 [Caerostris extrusa]|uniref:Uncharacterized protein n=1 Tax=Caerostris extrusa TaxID=172846 RepID=A0AAV4N0A3_CAEEX|nr:hypothetical protein CEXT_1071 [Caerostris extrusa]
MIASTIVQNIKQSWRKALPAWRKTRIGDLAGAGLSYVEIPSFVPVKVVKVILANRRKIEVDVACYPKLDDPCHPKVPTGESFETYFDVLVDKIRDQSVENAIDDEIIRQDQYNLVKLFV